MRILVVGAGSVGGYFGGRLAQAGRDVTFLVRPNRAQTLRSNGLHIYSPHGDYSFRPNVVTAAELDTAFDLILLSVKAWSVGDAITDLSSAVDGSSIIVPVLNGMKHIDLLTEAFGAERVVGGACKVATTLDPEGNIRQLTPFQELIYGELNGEHSSRVGYVDSVMQGNGFDARVSNAILREMWEKWALLATLGAATCLMRGNIGQIVGTPHGADFMTNLFGEVVSSIQKVGSSLSEGFINSAKGILTQPGSQMTSSMYRDLQKGERIERDQLIDDLIVRSQAVGLEMPLLTLVSTNLRVYESLH